MIDRRWRGFPLAVAICLCFLELGCSGWTQRVFGNDSPYLLHAFDVLCVPGQDVRIRARLQGGAFLNDQEDRPLVFRGPEGSVRQARTDDEGYAEIGYRPEEPGEYRFTVEIVPAEGEDERLPSPAELLVACRRPQTPVAVIDLDGTLVASGFDKVLVGDPNPMPRSVEVMQRVAQHYTVVYLTHRTDHFGPKSRRWLEDHDYPLGPLLLSKTGDLLTGSEEYKARRLGNLRSQFERVEVGVGDRFSDARVYLDQGMRSVLVVHLDGFDEADDLRDRASDLDDLPEGVLIATDWREVEKAIFTGRGVGRDEARRRLLNRARRLD
jgi:hypothetical protein